MGARPLPPPPEQWPSHMDAAQVAFVTGCSKRQVRQAAEKGELEAPRLTGSYGRKLWSREQIKAWRGIKNEEGDPFLGASAA